MAALRGASPSSSVRKTLLRSAPPIQRRRGNLPSMMLPTQSLASISQVNTEFILIYIGRTRSSIDAYNREINQSDSWRYLIGCMARIDAAWETGECGGSILAAWI